MRALFAGWVFAALLAAVTGLTRARGAVETPRSYLDRFMQARLRRNELLIDAMLSDRLRILLRTRPPAAGSVGQFTALYQVSNPCWYRYELLSLAQPAADEADARVRVYQHFWQGDIAGGPPTSWQQAIVLRRIAGGWQVDVVGPQADAVPELSEPHGLHTSACSIPRAAP